MGHKGVSIRKPKRPFSNADIKGNAKGRAVDRTPVQSLVKDQGALLNSGDLNSPAGSNKLPKKR